MKRKLLAALLAAAMLCAFAGVGASAGSPEEELQAQGRALLEETFAIFNSGKFTLKGVGTTPGEALFPGGTDTVSPIVIVADGNKYVIENEIDWVENAKTVGSSTAMGLAMQKLCGNKVRLILSSKRAKMVCPDRKLYFSIPFADVDPSALMPVPKTPPEELEVSEVEIDGLTYLCVTTASGDGSILSFYYLNGELKRMVTAVADDESVSMSIEIDSLAAGADQSYFSTRWMFRLPFLLLLFFNRIFNA